MTPEERERYDRIDRQLEFLAAQAASQDERIRLHSEQIARHSEQIAQLATHTENLQGMLLRLGKVVEEQARVHTRTEERLNILIEAVERYFTDGNR